MTTSTAHTETQAGARTVLLGCPHCGTPALLLRIETPIPVTVTPDQPRPVRPRRLHRPPGRAHPRRGTRPRTLGVGCICCGWSTPAPNFPDHLTPPAGRPAPHRKEQPCPSPSSPVTPPPTPRSVSLRYSLVSRQGPRGVRGRGPVCQGRPCLPAPARSSDPIRGSAVKGGGAERSGPLRVEERSRRQGPRPLVGDSERSEVLSVPEPLAERTRRPSAPPGCIRMPEVRA